MRNDAVAHAARVLRNGGLVAVPTETVYGLAADARNEAAISRIFAVKGRPARHPLIVHIASAASLEGWARDVPPIAWALARRFWPGPLTLVLRRAAGVSPLITGGQDTVPSAFRGTRSPWTCSRRLTAGSPRRRRIPLVPSVRPVPTMFARCSPHPAA